jgi:guanylate kinase
MVNAQTTERRILVLIGPPGVGKKFYTLRLNGNHPMDLDILKTITTQPQRQVYDSLFYRTVGLEEFQRCVAGGELVEHDEFAGDWYGIERADATAILKQKHAIVSTTPLGAESLRRSGFPTIVAYLMPSSRSLIENNLRQKQDTPERIAFMRQVASEFERLPPSAYDLAVQVKSLQEAERQLEDKLRAFLELH